MATTSTRSNGDPFDDPFAGPGPTPGDASSGSNFAEQPRSPEEALREKLVKDREITDTFTCIANKTDQKFVVLTQLEDTYRGWRFETYVTLNGKQTDNLDYPELEREHGSGPKEEEPPVSFLRRALQKHQEKCAAVKEIVDRLNGEAQQRRKRRLIMMAAGLALLAILVSGLLWFTLRSGQQHIQQVVAIGKSFNYALPVAPVTQVELLENPADWVHFDSQTLQLNGTPQPHHAGSQTLTFTTHKKFLGLLNVPGKLLVTLIVQEGCLPAQLEFQYVPARKSTAIQRDQANGIVNIKVQRPEMITIEVLDQHTGQVIGREVLEIELAK